MIHHRKREAVVPSDQPEIRPCEPNTVQKIEVHESHYFSCLAKRYLAGEHQVFFLQMCFCLFHLKKHRTSTFS